MSRPQQNQVADFQHLLASGDSPEAKELAYALETQKGGVGSWGPKSKAAFAKACEVAGVKPEAVDFSNPFDPELLKLTDSLREKKNTPDGHETSAPPKSLKDILGNDLGQITQANDYMIMNDIQSGGNDFADKVIAAAKKNHVDLKSIPELKNADLDGDGKITKEEICTLIETAHRKRAGTPGFVGVNENDPNHDYNIRPEDLLAMTDPQVVATAKKALEDTKNTNLNIEDLILRNPFGLPDTHKPDTNPWHQPFRDTPEQGNDNGKNDHFKQLLDKYAFGEKRAYGSIDISDETRGTAAIVGNALPISKDNGIV